jgi:hypothetical protein
MRCGMLAANTAVAVPRPVIPMKCRRLIEPFR